MITVLQSTVACSKHFTSKHESVDYDRLFGMTFQQHTCSSPEELHEIIEGVSQYTDMAVVNARPLKDEPEVMKYRLLYDKYDDTTGIIRERTLEGYAHNWCCIDYDKDELPDYVTIHEAPEWVVQNLLPDFMKSSSYTYQFSSSAMMKNNSFGKMHLWFYLDTPLTNKEFSCIIEPERRGLDPATFRYAQVLYTANPTFVEGLEDPFITMGVKRIGFVDKGSIAVVDKQMLNTVRDSIKKESTVRTKDTASSLDVLMYCGMEMANIIYYAGKRYHYSDLLKMASSLLRCNVSEHNVEFALSNLVDPSSSVFKNNMVKEVVKSAVKTVRQGGISTGIPWLEEQCGTSINEVKKIIRHKYV